MRVLAIDLGKKRTGLAISDPTGLIARPLEVVPCGDAPAAVLGAVEPVVSEYEVDRLVVGLPRRMDGGEGDEAAAARAVAAHLEAALARPVELWDERLTTVEATQRMIDAGSSKRRRRTDVDMVAAAVILQSYLDAQRMDAAT